MRDVKCIPFLVAFILIPSEMRNSVMLASDARVSQRSAYTSAYSLGPRRPAASLTTTHPQVADLTPAWNAESSAIDDSLVAGG